MLGAQYKQADCFKEQACLQCKHFKTLNETDRQTTDSEISPIEQSTYAIKETTDLSQPRFQTEKKNNVISTASFPTFLQ